MELTREYHIKEEEGKVRYRSILLIVYLHESDARGQTTRLSGTARSIDTTRHLAQSNSQTIFGVFILFIFSRVRTGVNYPLF
jgi:hypothetical protein